jgi:hypothetical protein
MAQEPHGFVWVGNHPGLDLVNTEGPLELVPDWCALVDWAWAAGLIDDALAGRCRDIDEGRARGVLAWFRRLRSSLRAVLEFRDGADAAALDAAVAEVPVRLVYRPAADRPVDATSSLDRLRLALATAALDATRLEPSRVRRCGSPRCVLLYYDTTKNRSRRWCDMAVCGNRAKASAYYHRTKQLHVQSGTL